MLRNERLLCEQERLEERFNHVAPTLAISLETVYFQREDIIRVVGKLLDDRVDFVRRDFPTFMQLLC